MAGKGGCEGSQVVGKEGCKGSEGELTCTSVFTGLLVAGLLVLALVSVTLGYCTAVLGLVGGFGPGVCEKQTIKCRKGTTYSNPPAVAG